MLKCTCDGGSALATQAVAVEIEDRKMLVDEQHLAQRSRPALSDVVRRKVQISQGAIRVEHGGEVCDAAIPNVVCLHAVPVVRQTAKWQHFGQSPLMSGQSPRMPS